MTKTGTCYKALFLLVVFSLNTIVGFACSQIGLFHNSHHHSEGVKPHNHTEKADHNHGHDHEHGSGHNHPEKNNQDTGKENCCSGTTVNFEKLEKWASRTVDPPAASFFVTLFFTSFPSAIILEQRTLLQIPLHLRWRPLETIPDLRTVIQSFQI